MENGQSTPELEVQQRTPEEQAIIDRTVDAIVKYSITKEGRNPRIVDGLRKAALLVVSEVDGTSYGFGRLASFYADHGAESPRSNYDSLRFAASIAESFPVEAEVAERLVAQCVQQGEPHHAPAIARNALERNLTDDEVLELARHEATNYGMKSSGDREHYLRLAEEHDVSYGVVIQINQLFDHKDYVWANDID